MKLEQISEPVALNRVQTLNNVDDATELMQRNCRIQISFLAAKLNTASLMKKKKKNNCIKKLNTLFWVDPDSRQKKIIMF